jgi:hypothetical protein
MSEASETVPSPPLPPPIVPINEWSCTLACLSWNLHKIKLPISQDDLIIRYCSHFPKWIHYKGLLCRGDILVIMELLGLPFRRAILSNRKREILDFVSANIHNYLMAFAITRKPSNHCMAVASWDGTNVTLMNAELPSAGMNTFTWDAFLTERDADILMTFL